MKRRVGRGKIHHGTDVALVGGMSIITVLIVGLLSGYMASHIVEGRGFGAFGDICLGLLGAIVGGFLFSNFGGIGHSLLGSVLTSTVGAVLLLSAAHLFRRRRSLAKI
jgi:uncharacterized membrane protein YeaQ/YmgE (transglycosylase-associated protein family)